MAEAIVAALITPFTEFAFMNRALFGSIFVSLAAGPLGVFLILRRMSLMADSMSHAILPGVAVAFLLAGVSMTAMLVGGLVTGLLVAMLAGIVISILFISNSRRRVLYAIYTVVLVLTFPGMADLMLRGHDVIPGKVQPTLIVWTAMTIMVEFWGRESDQAASTVGSDQSG